MKEQILAKIKILMQVKESSYLVSDGTDYQKVCTDIYVMLDQGTKNHSISYTDYIEIVGELNKVAIHAKKMKLAATGKSHFNPCLN
jgi:hypothetical protein